jgi:hypothetical protein
MDTIPPTAVPADATAEAQFKKALNKEEKAEETAHLAEKRAPKTVETLKGRRGRC